MFDGLGGSPPQNEHPTLSQDEAMRENPPVGPNTPSSRGRTPKRSSAGSKSSEAGGVFLLVDDNPINIKILVSYMKRLGHPYHTASNGLEAVNAFRESLGYYKAIFMDISMPVMDGFEATRLIRECEKQHDLRQCQIIALTGLASASAQTEAFGSGIDLFLTKPVRLKELGQILTTRNMV